MFKNTEMYINSETIKMVVAFFFNLPHSWIIFIVVERMKEIRMPSQIHRCNAIFPWLHRVIRTVYALRLCEAKVPSSTNHFGFQPYLFACENEIILYSVELAETFTIVQFDRQIAQLTKNGTSH